MAQKYALLIGINDYRLYDPTGGTNLSGCLNDVEDYRRLCMAMGYSPSNIHVLKDKDAKQANILAELGWLASCLNQDPQNEGVSSFSGHGSLYKGRPMLCAADLKWEDGLTFAKIGQALKVRKGINLSVFLDCCHSGARLRALRNCSDLEDDSRINRFLPPPDEDIHVGEFVDTIAAGSRDLLTPQSDSYRHLSSDHDLVLTGCQLNQTSADAYIGGAYHGAFTYYLMQVLRGATSAMEGEDHYYRVSYKALIERVATLLRRNGYDQVPTYQGPDQYAALDLFRLPKAARAEDPTPELQVSSDTPV